MSIQKLTDRHEGMMRDLIYNSFTPSEIRDKYGITLSRFSVIQTSPIWKDSAEKMRKIRDDMSKQALESSLNKLEGLRSIAVDRIGESMNSDNENIVLASARDILNRTGLSGDSEEKNSFKPVFNLYIPPHWKGREEGEERIVNVEGE